MNGSRLSQSPTASPSRQRAKTSSTSLVPGLHPFGGCGARFKTLVVAGPLAYATGGLWVAMQSAHPSDLPPNSDSLAFRLFLSVDFTFFTFAALCTVGALAPAAVSNRLTEWLLRSARRAWCAVAAIFVVGLLLTVWNVLRW